MCGCAATLATPDDVVGAAIECRRAQIQSTEARLGNFAR
jgi:hypothetical protein